MGYEHLLKVCKALWLGGIVNTAQDIGPDFYLWIVKRYLFGMKLPGLLFGLRFI